MSLANLSQAYKRQSVLEEQDLLKSDASRGDIGATRGRIDARRKDLYAHGNGRFGKDGRQHGTASLSRRHRGGRLQPLAGDRAKPREGRRAHPRGLARGGGGRTELAARD